MMLADGVWVGHMAGWWWLMLILPLVLLVGLALALTQAWTRTNTTPTRRALDILEERYALGEIDREEYLTRRRDLE